MSAIEIDAAHLPLLLHELRLPAIGRLWSEFAERADKEGWPAARFLSALAELEIAERGQRRIGRNLAEAHLLPGAIILRDRGACGPAIRQLTFSFPGDFG